MRATSNPLISTLLPSVRAYCCQVRPLLLYALLRAGNFSTEIKNRFTNVCLGGRMSTAAVIANFYAYIPNRYSPTGHEVL